MPSHVLKVLYRLKSKGYMGLLVGGALRDLMRYREPRDFDVATDAPLEELRSLFRNSKIIGKRFPIVHAYFGNEVVEISSLKGEDGQVGDDLIYADAVRRDFTANAVFYNIDGFLVLDPLNAIPHIENGEVVCIGDATEKFTEDAVRMLRALKLVAKQGFALSTELEESIRRHAVGVEDISPGRKYEEITRIILDKSGLSILSLCVKYSILPHLWPQGQEMLDHYGLGYFDVLRQVTPVSYSRGSFAKHSHTHLWLKLYLDSRYFKPSLSMDQHKRRFDQFLEPLAMPFRAPILEAAIILSRLLLDPHCKPEHRLSKEVLKLLEVYLESTGEEIPEAWARQFSPHAAKDRPAPAKGNTRRRQRRRRRGGRGKSPTSPT